MVNEFWGSNVPYRRTFTTPRSRIIASISDPLRRREARGEEIDPAPLLKAWDEARKSRLDLSVPLDTWARIAPHLKRD